MGSDLDVERNRVAVVCTGGTIASVHSDDRDGGVKVALSASELLAEVAKPPGIQVGPVMDLGRVNSWNIDPALMWTVARTVSTLSAQNDVDGVVVTHGTDTIEETAFLVEVLNAADKPVVFTAAMRSADALSPDGPHNLNAALRAAASPALRGMGTIVCLDNQLHAARWVQKWHTHSTAAFSSPVGAVGSVDPDGVVRRTCGTLARWSLPAIQEAEQPSSDTVPVIQAYTGMSAAALEGIVRATSPRGIVIDGFGLGHVPACLLDLVGKLMADEVLVVVSTRVPTGGTWALYGGPGGGRELADMGVLTAGQLTAGKARLLLLACLTGRDPVTAQQLFEQAAAILGQGAERPIP